MKLRIFFAFLVVYFAQGIHGAPSPSKEVDVVLIPNQPKLPVIIFEFKENDGEDENEFEENYSNETSTSTSPGTSTVSPLQSDEESEDSKLNEPVVAKGSKYNLTKARSRRAVSSEQHSITEGPDNYSGENDTGSSTTLGPLSGELVVASEEDDNGTLFTRVSIFRVVAVPFEASGNSSEETDEDNDMSTPAPSTKRNPAIHHLKKRQAGGYGSSDASGNSRAIAPEALTANVTAPTYIGEMSSPQAPMSATGGPSTPAAGGSTPAPAGSAMTSAAPTSANASSASFPSASTSSAPVTNGTTTTTSSAGAPNPAGIAAAVSSTPPPSSSPSTTAAPVVVAAPAVPAGAPPPPASLTAVQASTPPLLCAPPPPEQGSSSPAPSSNVMQSTTSAPAGAAPGGPRGLGY